MLDRKTPPSFIKSSSFLLPVPETTLLSSGIKVHSVVGVQQDIIKIEFIFKAGKWFESKVGLSHFTSHMVERGTAEKTSAQLAEFFDRYGAHVEIGPGLDFVSIALYSLSKNLRKVFPVFLEMLKTPSFPENELRQMKEVFLENLKVNNEKSSFLASKVLRKNIFGNTHPYGGSIEPEDVSSLTREDIRYYFNEYLQPSEVFVVSKSDQSIIDYLCNNISSFSKSKSTNREYRNQVSGPFFEKIDKANTVQSSVRLGKKTISRSHPDYFNLIFLNHVLGGYFGSRLMKNIREEKGLTYGIQSSVNSLLQNSFIVIGADVNQENEQLILQEIRNEFSKLQTSKIDQDELDSAKGYFIGSLQSETSNPFSVVEKIKTLKLFSLKESYYQDLLDQVSSVASDDLLEAAQKHLRGDEFYKVVVG